MENVIYGQFVYVKHDQQRSYWDCSQGLSSAERPWKRDWEVQRRASWKIGMLEIL